jgi:hypothetical protein
LANSPAGPWVARLSFADIARGRRVAKIPNENFG